MTAFSPAPVVLDLDGSVGALPGEIRLPLAEAWQERMRFGCGLRTMRVPASTRRRSIARSATIEA